MCLHSRINELVHIHEEQTVCVYVNSEAIDCAQERFKKVNTDH